VDGIAVTPVGKAAWFKDSEGNVLTITQLGYGTAGVEVQGLVSRAVTVRG
jgi:hypothetical protein